MDDYKQTIRERTTETACNHDVDDGETKVEPTVATGFWSRTLTIACLIVLGITPWAHAQLAAPNEPAFCPPLTSLATPTLFNFFTGTTPFRFPFQ